MQLHLLSAGSVQAPIILMSIPARSNYIFTWIDSWTKPDKICNSLPRKREASKSRLTKWATQKRNAPKKEEKINEKFKQVGGELMMGDKLMMNNNHTVGLGKESRG